MITYTSLEQYTHQLKQANERIIGANAEFYIRLAYIRENFRIANSSLFAEITEKHAKCGRRLADNVSLLYDFYQSLALSRLQGQGHLHQPSSMKPLNDFMAIHEDKLNEISMTDPADRMSNAITTYTQALVAEFRMHVRSMSSARGKEPNPDIGDVLQKAFPVCPSCISLPERSCLHEPTPVDSRACKQSLSIESMLTWSLQASLQAESRANSRSLCLPNLTFTSMLHYTLLRQQKESKGKSKRRRVDWMSLEGLLELIQQHCLFLFLLGSPKYVLISRSLVQESVLIQLEMHRLKSLHAPLLQECFHVGTLASKYKEATSQAAKKRVLSWTTPMSMTDCDSPSTGDNRFFKRHAVASNLLEDDAVSHKRIKLDDS